MCNVEMVDGTCPQCGMKAEEMDTNDNATDEQSS